MKMTAVKRFITDNSGSTAVEFAFVFPIFITMVLGILEFGVMAYMRGAVEEVTRNASRLAITGSVVGNDQNLTRTESLVNYIQNQASGVVVGGGSIDVSSTSYPNLASYSTRSGGTSGAGGGNSITEYQVNYNYQFFTPLAAFIQALNGDVVITSTAVVQNENF